MDRFQADWHRFHPNTHPVGHLLRQADGWNLTRFHLLPDNRKAAHDHAELRALLDRFNTVATAALGEGAPCHLVALQSPNQDKRHRARMERLKRRYGLTPGWEFHSTSDQLSYIVCAGEVTWTTNGFNRLLLHIYQTDFWDIMWMNRETGAIFRPYDAGADISQPTPNDLIARISTFYGWLPTGGMGFINFNQAQMATARFQVTKPCAEAIQRVIAAQTK
ncbi:hypothetical protein AEAC466_03705 [Asticcacaulis sp. AC466]|uniref:DUF3885 domain-containing protein n=1 Tax=Asticcacaulis sp. AC466 TaxID=1282362 RepID=UPI0003C40E80|nr:hypothetical protein [Asticcacaulis sp. AC466]ESQ86315.1 hypothetical protein AEAC466_03705 [Asticcacaulis sp. AC466]